MEGVKVDVEPERVTQGMPALVIVTGLGGHNPQCLLMQVVAGKDEAVMLPLRRLGTYASPGEGGPDTYEAVIGTVGYEPGDYIVDVSGSEPLRARDAASARFTVVAS